MKRTIFSIVFLCVLMLGSCGNKERIVLISTDYGDMKVKLYNETPLHRDNFVKLAKEGFFDGTLFHRVIKDFMIQGGDPDSKDVDSNKMLGGGGPGYTVEAEFVFPQYFHKKGALSAARQGDNVNPAKASSGSQFYIVQGKPVSEGELKQMENKLKVTFTDEQKKIYTEVGGTPFLDNNYTVFGEVIEGLEVIDKIAAVATKRGDRPVEDVKMTIKVLK
ncbi:MAG: peptidylprolyl isomerase [Chitinophagales bacterium]